MLTPLPILDRSPWQLTIYATTGQELSWNQQSGRMILKENNTAWAFGMNGISSMCKTFI